MWDYATLSKLAAKYGGPQNFVNAIFKAGLTGDFTAARHLGVTVRAPVGAPVHAPVGVITTGVIQLLAQYARPRVLKWFSSK